MNFSDYIIYVDESGDHGLTTINPEFPIFALSFCIIRKDIYINKIVPSIQQLKFNFFGHDRVIFHEKEIRAKEKDFAFWNKKHLQEDCLEKLNGMMRDAEMTIVSSAILKEKLYREHKQSYHPYNMALLFCVEQTIMFLQSNGQQNKLVHIIVESKGKEEDKDLELWFLRFTKNSDFTQITNIGFELKFASKQINSSGLQLADLTARPIAIKVLRPTQKNRAYDIIETKFPVTGGLRTFP